MSHKEIIYKMNDSQKQVANDLKYTHIFNLIITHIVL